MSKDTSLFEIESGNSVENSRRPAQDGPMSRPSYGQSNQQAAWQIGLPASGRILGRLRARLLVFWILIACITTMVVAIAGHFLVVAPLEQALLAEQARSLAKEVDGLIKARSAAISVAAGNLDIDNLSAAGGLDRLLSSLRALFPDFSNIEIINHRGQTIAMMGSLNLALAGTPTTPHVSTKTSLSVSDKLLFRDDPSNESFLIIMRHGDADSGHWFSRTRFRRTPIESVLNSAGASKSARLITHSGAIPDNVETQSDQKPVEDQESSTGQAVDRAHSGWWAQAKAAEINLPTPGWTIILERISRWSDYGVQVLIPGVLLLLLAIFYMRQRDPRRPKGVEQRVSEVAPSTEPEWDKSVGPLSEKQFELEELHGMAVNEVLDSPGLEQGACDDCHIRNISSEFDGTTEQGHPLGELLPEFFFQPSAGMETADPPPVGNNQETTEAEAEGQTDPIPDTLEVTWFEPPAEQIVSDEQDHVADSKFVGA
jgi:hypothetical protein